MDIAWRTKLVLRGTCVGERAGGSGGEIVREGALPFPSCRYDMSAICHKAAARPLRGHYHTILLPPPPAIAIDLYCWE